MTQTRADQTTLDPRELRLTITRTFDAPRELVWRAWTDPEHLMHWYAGQDCQPAFAELDLCVGGRWRSGMRWAQGDKLLVHHGEFREIHPPHRLVFTHAWEQNDVASDCQTTFESLVTVILEERDGRTDMTFEQVGFTTAESRDSHHGGWSNAFDSLTEYLRTSSAPDEADILISRVFHAPRELVWQACTQAKHIARWWGPRGFDTRVEKQDFRVGGHFRYVMVGPDGNEYPSQGVFKQIVSHTHYVSTDEFGEGFKHPSIQDLPESIAMTTTFEDVGEHTRLTVRISHPTVEDRKRHEAMGVVEGFASTLDCLEEHLAAQLDGRPARSTLTLVLPDETRIVVVRSFEAPRQLVFDAHTTPEQVQRWMFGPADWPMVECRIDLRVGGQMRYVWQNSAGQRCALTGTFREVDPPGRIVHTELFDEDWTGGETTVTTTFTEHDGNTMVASTVLYSSQAARDAALGTDMLNGWGQMLDRLDTMLAASASDAHT